MIALQDKIKDMPLRMNTMSSSLLMTTIKQGMIQIGFTVEVKKSRIAISFRKVSSKTGLVTSIRTRWANTTRVLGSNNSINRKGTIKMESWQAKEVTQANSRNLLKNKAICSKIKNIRRELEVNMKGD